VGDADGDLQVARILTAKAAETVSTDHSPNALRRATVWAFESVRRRGLVTTWKIAASAIEDSMFDLRYGTETSGVVDSDRLEPTLANRTHAVRYKATKGRPFLRLLARLNLPDGCTFVDVGSGKGKVLLLAAQHRFRRVVGLEFSPSICAQARRNIDLFGRTTKLRSPIEIVEGDATQYVLAGDENVFFLYNPFDAVILKQFVDNIRRSLLEHPRPIWFIYSVPLHAAVLEQSGLFRPAEAFDIQGNEFHVYRAEPAIG
jgi:SAM-dependent methyltransferase